MIWIRSQRKNNLVSVDNFHVDFNEDNYMFVITCEKWDSEYCLGEYSAEEKALHVLDMIQERIVAKQEHFLHSQYQEPIKVKKGEFVFQMPQENEV